VIRAKIIQISTAVPAVAVLLAPVAGCSSAGDTSSVIGTWSGRCSTSTDHDAALTARFAGNGAYSASSSGPDGETSGTYIITSPDTLSITNQGGTHVYHYQLSNHILTLTTSTLKGDETCNLNQK
jgi:hypothetical protein